MSYLDDTGERPPTLPEESIVKIEAEPWGEEDFIRRIEDFGRYGIPNDFLFPKEINLGESSIAIRFEDLEKLAKDKGGDWKVNARFDPEFNLTYAHEEDPRKVIAFGIQTAYGSALLDTNDVIALTTRMEKGGRIATFIISPNTNFLVIKGPDCPEEPIKNLEVETWQDLMELRKFGLLIFEDPGRELNFRRID